MDEVDWSREGRFEQAKASRSACRQPSRLAACDSRDLESEGQPRPGLGFGVEAQDAPTGWWMWSKTEQLCCQSNGVEWSVVENGSMEETMEGGDWRRTNTMTCSAGSVAAAGAFASVVACVELDSSPSTMSLLSQWPWPLPSPAMVVSAAHPAV